MEDDYRRLQLDLRGYCTRMKAYMLYVARGGRDDGAVGELLPKDRLRVHDRKMDYPVLQRPVSSGEITRHYDITDAPGYDHLRNKEALPEKDEEPFTELEIW
jgi:hypothetical protein